MNDSAPPPPEGAPQIWQNLGASPVHPGPPAFDPRRAVGSPAATAARQAAQPIMAPPPVQPDRLTQAAPSPYAQSPYAQSPYAQSAHAQSARAPSPYSEASSYTAPQAVAPPASVPQAAVYEARSSMGASAHGHTPGHQRQAYGAPQNYEYPEVTRAGPDALVRSFLSRLSRRFKSSDKIAADPEYPEVYRPKLDFAPATGAAYAPYGSQGHDVSHNIRQIPPQDIIRDTVETTALAQTSANIRKPFLMGLLTGVVVMLILGQIFRASAPSPDYAQTLSPNTIIPNNSFTTTPVSDDPIGVVYLESVEGLNARSDDFNPKKVAGT